MELKFDLDYRRLDLHLVYTCCVCVLILNIMKDINRILWMVVLLLGYLDTAYAVSGNLNKELSSSKCSAEVSNRIDKKLKKYLWTYSTVSIPNKPLYTSVQLRNTADKKVYEFWNDKKTSVLVELNMADGKQTVTTWNAEKKCEASVSHKPVLRFQYEKLTGAFDDKSLFQLINTNKNGLIYVWSPYMPLSVEAVANISKAAEMNKLPLKILVDGKASLSAAKEWAKKNNNIKPEFLTQVSSRELFSRSMTVHYPILFYYNDKFISNRTYIGHKETDIYDLWIKQEMSNLNEELK